MQFRFIKAVQFSLLIKAEGKLREFNFRKIGNTEEETLAVNVCNERSDRIFFNMTKQDKGWEFTPDNLPDLIELNKKTIRQAVEEELPNWQ